MGALMSTEEATDSDAATGPPDGQQALQKEIERTRGPLAAAVGTAVACVLALLLIRRWKGRS